MQKSAMEQQKTRKVGGSRKGRPNKLTADIKETIIASFYAVGGQAYLEEQAIKNPQVYMSILGKILPRENKNENTNTGSMNIKVTFE